MSELQLTVLDGHKTSNVGSLMSLLRDGGHVWRYHTERTPPQGVAEHSHGVAVILCFITTPSTHLLKAALFHDLSEKTVGDMPAPIKWNHPEIAKFLDTRSYEVDSELGIHVILTPEEKNLLRIADYMDAGYYALEHRLSGNKYADAIFNNLCWFFDSQVDFDVSPKAKEMWDWLKLNYERAQT